MNGSRVETVTTITAAQLDLLRHTLGLNYKDEPWRNHFMAGADHSAMADLSALESAGMMICRPAPAFCAKDDLIFHVTEHGRAYAMARRPPKPKRNRYAEFLDVGDCYDSFADFLGFVPPEYEVRSGFWSSDPTYYRMTSPRAIGEWGLTKKEAKANYKAALKSRQAEQRAWQKELTINV